MTTARLLLLLAPVLLIGCAREASHPVLSEHDRTMHALGLHLAKMVEPYDLTPEEVERVAEGFLAGCRGKGVVKPGDYLAQIGEVHRVRVTARADARKRSDAKLVAPIVEARGARVLPSGVVVLDVAAGAGRAPSPTDFVSLEYRTTLADGAEVDSTAREGRPRVVPLDRAIPCLSQGVQQMRVGGKAKLVCPYETAYGVRGGDGIPSGATLVVEVELRSIEKQ